MKWIRVKDEIPEVGRKVFIRSVFGEGSVTAKLIKKGRGYIWDSVWFEAYLSEGFVTHWRYP